MNQNYLKVERQEVETKQENKKTATSLMQLVFRRYV